MTPRAFHKSALAAFLAALMALHGVWIGGQAFAVGPDGVVAGWCGAPAASPEAQAALDVLNAALGGKPKGGKAAHDCAACAHHAACASLPAPPAWTPLRIAFAVDAPRRRAITLRPHLRGPPLGSRAPPVL